MTSTRAWGSSARGWQRSRMVLTSCSTCSGSGRDCMDSLTIWRVMWMEEPTLDSFGSHCCLVLARRPWSVCVLLPERGVETGPLGHGLLDFARVVAEGVDVLEGVAQLAIILEAVVGRALHHFPDEINPAVGHVGLLRELERPGLLEVAPDDVLDGGAIVRLLAGHEMEEGGAEGVDVGALVGGAALDLLGRDVGGGCRRPRARLPRQRP